jgi:hypothetical protein
VRLSLGALGQEGRCDGAGGESEKAAPVHGAQSSARGYPLPSGELVDTGSWTVSTNCGSLSKYG